MNFSDAARFPFHQAMSLGSDAFHIYVGLAVMLLAAIALKRSLADWRPIAIVALAAFAGPIWHVIDTFSHGGTPRWHSDWRAVWHTMFWPLVLFALARFTKILKR
jgi:hypothetical protein